jgi:hypothetical protein
MFKLNIPIYFFQIAMEFNSSGASNATCAYGGEWPFSFECVATHSSKHAIVYCVQHSGHHFLLLSCENVEVIVLAIHSIVFELSAIPSPPFYPGVKEIMNISLKIKKKSCCEKLTHSPINFFGLNLSGTIIPQLPCSSRYKCQRVANQYV